VGKPKAGKNGAFSITFNVPGAGVLDVLATYAHTAAKRFVYARVHRVVTAGRVVLVVKPRKAGLKALLRQRKLRLTIKITYTPKAGAKTTVTRRLVVKAPRKRAAHAA
jgi:hypothetical protein